jgi:DNA-binding transcriptional LysR family regulator
MKQRQLLIALDEHKSLHKAAGVMAMTQSAVSKVLQELESMFERIRNGMVPNQFGHTVIRHARLLITDLGALCQDMGISVPARAAGWPSAPSWARCPMWWCRF